MILIPCLLLKMNDDLMRPKSQGKRKTEYRKMDGNVKVVMVWLQSMNLLLLLGSGGQGTYCTGPQSWADFRTSC